MGRFKSWRGFTLIEAMITLVAAGLLLAWGVPSFQRLMDNMTLSSATNEWVGLVNQARNEAVTRGERVTICRTVTPDACDGTSNCNCGVDQSGPEKNRPNYHRGWLVFTSTGNAQSINFRPGNGNTLIITGRAQSETVTIRGNNRGNNAFSFMPDGTLDPNDENSGLTVRHVICTTDSPADLTASANSENSITKYVAIEETGRPRVGVLLKADGSYKHTDCSGDEADGEGN